MTHFFLNVRIRMLHKFIDIRCQVSAHFRLIPIRNSINTTDKRQKRLRIIYFPFFKKKKQENSKQTLRKHLMNSQNIYSLQNREQAQQYTGLRY